MNPEKSTILVIEDDALLLGAIKIKLTEKKYRNICVSTAEEALKILKKDRIDLIWLDLLLPGMDGFELLEKIKKDNLYKDIPVIIVSNVDSEEKISSALKYEVYNYLVKSDFSLADIIKKIEDILDK